MNLNQTNLNEREMLLQCDLTSSVAAFLCDSIKYRLGDHILIVFSEIDRHSPSLPLDNAMSWAWKILTHRFGDALSMQCSV